MITDMLRELTEGRHLDADDTQRVIEGIIDGSISPVQAAAFLTALRAKGETVNELIGAARAMRAHVTPVNHTHPVVIDTCGTGGDHAGTFNISTTTAFVLAGAGLKVAKHGNRSISSRSGSADVLEALGARLDLNPVQVAACLDRTGIGFLFAPNLHPAMKSIGPVRRELGFRTVFNLLGPLTNPAFATHQVIGVFDPEYIEPVAIAASELGVQGIFAVHNSSGLDELATCGVNYVATVIHGDMYTFEIDPEHLGLPRCQPDALHGGDACDNAQITRDILNNHSGPPLDTVLLNAALGLYCAGAVSEIGQGIEIALESIASGAAREALHQFVSFTNTVHRAA
jgi:anthranilate phosphoribosyltransferase